MRMQNPRKPCVECERTMAIIAFGRCATCYRRKRGIQHRRGVCIDCHRYMSIAHAGLCWTCAAHRRNPHTRRNKVRTAFADMFGPVGPLTPQLSPDEQAALTTVIRMTGHA